MSHLNARPRETQLSAKHRKKTVLQQTSPPSVVQHSKTHCIPVHATVGKTPACAQVPCTSGVGRGLAFAGNDVRAWGGLTIGEERKPATVLKEEEGGKKKNGLALSRQRQFNTKKTRRSQGQALKRCRGRQPRRSVGTLSNGCCWVGKPFVAADLHGGVRLQRFSSSTRGSWLFFASLPFLAHPDAS